MTAQSMNHQQALEEHATERYLLGEMAPEERRAFEEHYLECPECLEAVTFGADFMEAGRQVALEDKSMRVSTVVPTWRERLLAVVSGGLRPVAALSCALLLGLVGIGYQAATIHRQRQTIASLQDLRPEYRFVLTGESRGKTRIIKVRHNTQLSVKVEFTPGEEFTPYRADLLSADSKVSYSMPLSVAPTDDSVSFSIPAAGLDAGSYSLVIRRQNKAGASDDMKSNFVLQFAD